MSGTIWAVEPTSTALAQLRERAATLVATRPAYRELIKFYEPVFCRQIEWRGRIVAGSEPLDVRWALECLSDGAPLVERFEPGIGFQSVLDLWAEMKGLFRRGNAVLAEAMDHIDDAERRGVLAAAPWLLEQRPERGALVAEAARQCGVDEAIMGTLARAVTLPHWARVAGVWLPESLGERWRGQGCPVCGGPPALAETRQGVSGDDNLTGSNRRFLHCAFCATRWLVPSLSCPFCATSRSGDARYYFTKEEPDIRIDYCGSCRHYLKTIDGDRLRGAVHVGLEQLASTHLDIVAEDMDLTPVQVFDDRCSGGRYWS